MGWEHLGPDLSEHKYSEVRRKILQFLHVGQLPTIPLSLWKEKQMKEPYTHTASCLKTAGPKRKIVGTDNERKYSRGSEEAALSQVRS